MRNKIIYTDEPMKYRVIKDFLPKPEDIDFSDEKVRVIPSSIVHAENLAVKVSKRKSAVSRNKKNDGAIVLQGF